MPDITNADFLAAISNTSVSACFTSSGTLPNGISPAVVLDSILDAYKTAQNESNQANTGTTFINTIANFRTEPILLDGNGNPYGESTTTVRIRKIYEPASTESYMGGRQII